MAWCQMERHHENKQVNIRNRPQKPPKQEEGDIIQDECFVLADPDVSRYTVI